MTSSSPSVRQRTVGLAGQLPNVPPLRTPVRSDSRGCSESLLPDFGSTEAVNVEAIRQIPNVTRSGGRGSKVRARRPCRSWERVGNVDYIESHPTSAQGSLASGKFRTPFASRCKSCHCIHAACIPCYAHRDMVPRCSPERTAVSSRMRHARLPPLTRELVGTRSLQIRGTSVSQSPHLSTRQYSRIVGSWIASMD
jgi:hypothetical protein